MFVKNRQKVKKWSFAIYFVMFEESFSKCAKICYMDILIELY